MNTAPRLALVAAVSAFLFASAIASPPAVKPQKVRVTVDDGFKPEVLQAPAGRPLVLVLTGKHVFCANKVVFKSLGLTVRVRNGKRTLINIPAQAKGTSLDYACSMGMYKGKIMFQ